MMIIIRPSHVGMWWIFISDPHLICLHLFFHVLPQSRNTCVFIQGAPGMSKSSSLLSFKPERSKKPCKKQQEPVNRVHVVLQPRLQWCHVFRGWGKWVPCPRKDRIPLFTTVSSFGDAEKASQFTHMYSHHVAPICIHIDHLALLSEFVGRTIRKVFFFLLSFKHASIGMHLHSPAAIAIGNTLSHPAKWLQM